jgi:hypothetical protein
VVLSRFNLYVCQVWLALPLSSGLFVNLLMNDLRAISGQLLRLLLLNLVVGVRGASRGGGQCHHGFEESVLVGTMVAVQSIPPLELSLELG